MQQSTNTGRLDERRKEGMTLRNGMQILWSIFGLRDESKSLGQFPRARLVHYIRWKDEENT